jgi:hypothetical protein
MARGSIGLNAAAFLLLTRGGGEPQGAAPAPSPSPQVAPAPDEAHPKPPRTPTVSAVVIDVFPRGGGEVVHVEVDGQTHTACEGERFAQNFQVVSIEGECATFLFGDENFTTCEGGRPK